MSKSDDSKCTQFSPTFETITLTAVAYAEICIKVIRYFTANSQQIASESFFRTYSKQVSNMST